MARRKKTGYRWIEEALYGGTCRGCRGEIQVGDRILYSKCEGARCAPCGERLKAEQSRARRAVLAAGDFDAFDVFDGSDAAITRGFLAALRRRGRAGEVAALLFTAQKSSRRAKKYGYSRHRDRAYGRKGETLSGLCDFLAEHGAALGFRFGWGEDEGGPQPFVLYVDVPGCGQCSFHSPERYAGPDYPEKWDGARASERRILAYCDSVMRGERRVGGRPGRTD